MLVPTATTVEFRLVSPSKAFSISVPLNRLRRVSHVVVERWEGLFTRLIIHQLRFAWDPESVIATFEVPAEEVCVELRMLRTVWPGPISQPDEWRKSCAAMGKAVQPAPYVIAINSRH